MRSIPLADTVLRERDTLILGGEPDVLERVISRDKLALTGQDRDKKKKKDEKKGSEIGVIEAVVNTESPLIGQSAGRLRLQERYGVNLTAVSRRGERLVKRDRKSGVEGKRGAVRVEPL